MAGTSIKNVAADLGLAMGSIAELQHRALLKLGVGSLEDAIALSENLLELFRQTPGGAAPTIAPRLTREDLRELRNAYAGITRGLASAIAVLDRIEGGSE